MKKKVIHTSLTVRPMLGALCWIVLAAPGCSGQSVELEEEPPGSGGGSSKPSTPSSSGECAEKLYFEEFEEPYGQCSIVGRTPEYATEDSTFLSHAMQMFPAPGQECRVCQPDYPCEDDSDCPASLDEGATPVCLDNFCRIECSEDADCPGLLVCVEDQDARRTCAMPRDPFGELDLVSQGGICERSACADHTTQADCEATLDAAEHHLTGACIWVEERLFHDNASSCEEVETRGSCRIGDFALGENSDSVCDATPLWVDYGAGTVSLLSTSRCDYAINEMWNQFGDEMGVCDPNDPTAPAVCDCACD